MNSFKRKKKKSNFKVNISENGIEELMCREERGNGKRLTKEKT